MPTFTVPDYKPTHSLSDFEFVHDPKDKRSKLGVGSFATVKLAKEKKTGKLYALKTIDIDSKKATKTDIQNLKTEIGIHKDLDHPNIVKFHGYIHQDNFVYLILDYAENGNLYAHIHRKKTLTEKEIFKFFHQTCLAIDYLHQNNIIHRDLKPENLLLDKDFNLKVCDFGWSAYHINQERKTFCGTYEYMAPEIVHKKTYDYRVDVWALGILLYELIHGKAPYPGRSAQEIKASFAKFQITFDPKIQPDAKELIQKILKDNPTSRMQIEQILSDKWVTSRLKEEQPAQKQDLKIDLRSVSAGSGSKPKVPNKSLHVFTQPFSQVFNTNPFVKQEFAPNSATTPKDNSCKSLQERSPNLVSPTFHHQPFSAVFSNQRNSTKKTPKKLFTKKIFDNGQLSPSFNDRLERIMGNLSTKNCSMIQNGHDITIDVGSTILHQEKTSRADLGSQRNELKPKKYDNFNYKSVPHSQRDISESKRIKIFDNNNSFMGERNEVRRKITFRTIEEVNGAKYQGSFSDKTMFENKENVGFQKVK